jgi:hypothetical protein
MKSSGQNLKPLRTTVHEVSAPCSDETYLIYANLSTICINNNSARILGQSMGARNRVKTELS